MNYYVFADGLVGLKTNEKHFRWSFGSDAPPASEQDFQRCRCKLVLETVRDRDVFPAEETEHREGRFRYFCAKRDGMELLYSRKLPGPWSLRWSLRIEGDTVYARVGRTYRKAVRLKIMNLHPISYVLFELTNALLLEQGFAVLYGSAFSLGASAALIMAPPNAGKTFTALRLSEDWGAELLSEDICIFDGEKLYPVPWTNTYRGKTGQSAGERAARFRRSPAAATHLFFLDREIGSGAIDREEAKRRARLLNRYDLRWYCSPALMVLDYYNGRFSLDALRAKENALLDALVEGTEGFAVSARAPGDYAALVARYLAGENDPGSAEKGFSKPPVL